MIVLAPFQKLGVGSNFIKQIYDHYIGLKNVVDITVEDPSNEFRKMRNLIDSKLCKDLKSFSEDNLKKGFSKDMVKEARNALKVNCWHDLENISKILKSTIFSDKSQTKQNRLRDFALVLHKSPRRRRIQELPFSC